ncbi:hypothetical protein APHAL10511_008247 [Amanita phalloides]|nr:hypothetical protein APHAL10511_008247 [Amanita phalloides]
MQSTTDAPRSFSTDVTNAKSAAPPARSPTPSTPAPAAAPSRTPSFTKTSAPIVPQKRTLIEFMLEISWDNMKHLHEEARLKHIDAQHAQLFEEFKAGIWTAPEFKKKVRKLTKHDTVSSAGKHQEHCSSPDWDSELPSSDN